MLDHFHVEDHVEGRPFGHQRLGGGGAVVDVQARLGGMGAGGADIALRGVGAGDGKPQPRHGLGQQPAAAADIQQASAPRTGAGPRCRVRNGRPLRRG